MHKIPESIFGGSASLIPDSLLFAWRESLESRLWKGVGVGTGRVLYIKFQGRATREYIVSQHTDPADILF